MATRSFYTCVVYQSQKSPTIPLFFLAKNVKSLGFEKFRSRLSTCSVHGGAYAVALLVELTKFQLHSKPTINHRFKNEN